MNELGNLQRKGRESAERRGHYMSAFTSFSDTRAEARCLSCGMGVFVKTNPMPNEIDISGEAVALNCRKEVIGA